MAMMLGYKSSTEAEFSKNDFHLKSSPKDESNEKWTSFRKELSNFADGVSIVGFKYVFLEGASLFRRLIWLLFVVGGAIFMCYQVQGRIGYYLSNPTTVSIKYNQKTSVDFPTITICSENRMTKSALDDLGIRDTMEALYPPWDDESYVPEIDYEILYSLHKNIAVHELEMYLADLHFVHHCLFDGKPCKPDRRISTSMGLCVQFNSNGTWTLSKAGIKYGFQVVLFSNDSDYGVIGGLGQGMKMLIHDKDDFPDMLNWGVSMPAGWNSNFPLAITNVSSPGKPYVDCDDTPGYKRSVCLAECQARYYVTECSCCPHYLPCNDLDYDRYCSYFDHVTCLDNATDLWYQRGMLSQCNCEQQCNYIDYPFSSHSTIMSGKFANFIVNEILDEGVMSMADAQKGYTKANLYLAELRTEEIETKMAYPLLSLLCDIGGALGLILGSTVLTVMEFVDFFITSALQYSSSYKRQGQAKKIRVNTGGNKY